MKSRELREKRAKLIADARALVDKATAEKRSLTAEEQTQYDAMFKDIEQLRQDIERIEKLEVAEREMSETINDHRAGREGPTPGGDQGPPAARPSGSPAPAAAARTSADREISYRGAMPAGPHATEAYQQAFRRYLFTGNAAGLDRGGESEARALQADLDVSGGYIVAPQQLVMEILRALDDAVFIRARATVRTIGAAASLGVPSLESDPSDADWTSELKVGNEDTSMAFGKRELRPYPLAKYIKISNKLLRSAILAPERLVRDRLEYKFGISQEKAFLLGPGAGQPLGVFVASSDGIPTSRDVVTGSATDFTADGLKNAKYTLKGGYWKNAAWMFHRDGVKKIALLKDGNQRYLWEDSIKVGEPDRLLGFPVSMSEHVPNTFTTGLYVGILADWSFYWIVDALDMQIQRLNELFALTNQTGLIGRLETDGMPVLAEAFVRLKTS